jgi:threonine dehydratase
MTLLFSSKELDAAAEIVHRVVAPTPQYAWPLLAAELGCEVWVKHENHTPIGAFKIRGGLVLLEGLRHRREPVTGLVTATRGNHGQSLALAGRRHGIPVTIIVPEGNSIEKNAAMQGFGADLQIHGRDFDEAREYATGLAHRRGCVFVAPFHPDLVRGVATYALELFTAVGELDAVYVPVGMGSGICGLITVRDLLGLRTAIVGVVAQGAPAYARSFAAGRPVCTAQAATFIDGVACRVPDPLAVQVINAGAEEIVEISDEDTAAAMRLLYHTTHNLAEPAGAIAIAALARHRHRHRDGRVAVVLTGGNVDAEVFAAILSGVPIRGGSTDVNDYREVPEAPRCHRDAGGAGTARSPQRWRPRWPRAR